MQALPPSDGLHHQIERAWYVLTVLLRLGRPARPLELDPDPDLVEYLSQINGSPLFLTGDGFITVSESALRCFFQYWSNLAISSAARAGTRVCENWSRWGQVGLVGARKRKASGYECVMPVTTKRRLLIGSERVTEELEKDENKFIQSVDTSIAEKSEKEVHLDVPDNLLSFFTSSVLNFLSREKSIHSNQCLLQGNGLSDSPSIHQICELVQAANITEAEKEEEMPIQFYNPNDCIALGALSHLTVPDSDMNTSENMDGRYIGTMKQVESIDVRDLAKEEQEVNRGNRQVQLQASGEGGERGRDGDTLKIQGKKVSNCISLKKRVKGAALENKLPNETNVNHAANASKSQPEPKLFPNLKDFTIEEEEGSGGYGTVYKARRKSDGKIFAVKCPHPNANSHHVNNEMKMLERFGGRNFVIKYEGSFKSGKTECFLLEHVEHDRPEILKKEITVFELRWYGYCLFKALASLHKQGIAHRDVKPGNFLFSRRLSKGYLIDFNLASDLHQRFLRNATRTDSAPLFAIKPKSNHPQESQNQNLKRKRSTRNPSDVATKHESKGYYSQKTADVSGVTSVKDQTSTRNSQERRNQPIMYQALRKEIVHFLKDTTQSSPNKEVVGPSSQRKRVAAPPTRSDRSRVIFTPMPLYCGGAAVVGSTVHKSKGEGKHRKEGPCVGTKGFRAPEVLFKSFHQSCKIDIWSTGVTLLYLIIGRTPFGGDPEQNIKDIAKLRGSEDMWEVAKLHNCESSFPKELFDVRSLQSVDLRDWCEANSRRPEFIQAIPDSLFDLIDKCLTANPRCRISAEEALAHYFFLPCHERLRKQRLLRKSSQPCTTQLSINSDEKDSFL